MEFLEGVHVFYPAEGKPILTGLTDYLLTNFVPLLDMMQGIAVNS